MKSRQQQVAVVGNKGYTRKTIALTLGVLAMLALAARVEATVIEKVVNVQFGYPTTSGGVDLNGQNSSLTISPLQYTGSTWTDDSNDIHRALSKTNLPDSNGNPTTIGFKFLGGTITTGNWNQDTATLLLLQSCLIENALDTLEITGLDNSRLYDIYLPSYYVATTHTTFTINGTPQTVTEANLSSWSLDQNFAEFTGIAPTSGHIDVGLAGAGGWPWSLAGFQVGLEAVPEPGIILLFGLGAGILWLRRRRQQAAV